MSWKAVARSIVGTSHVKLGMPCQDFGGDRILDELLIGAVADGAGSAKYAEVGAQLAVRTAIDTLTQLELTAQQEGRSIATWTQSAAELQAVHWFRQTVATVRSTLQQKAVEQNREISDYACTLLMVLATPCWVAAMQIGDGFIVMRRSLTCREAVLANDFSHSHHYQLLFQPDKGEYANQTAFVTSASALNDLQVKVLPTAAKTFICVATDGLERVAIRLKDWTPFAPFFEPLESYVQATNFPLIEDQYVIDFLESDRLNQKTDDDKTLLLCFYE